MQKLDCDFRTFRVKESFWAKQQSCITLKVSLRKWCPFFVFVCFSGCHFTQDGFTKKDNVQKIFFEFLHVFLTFLHIILKIWKYILLLSFLSQNSRCGQRVQAVQNIFHYIFTIHVLSLFCLFLSFKKIAIGD